MKKGFTLIELLIVVAIIAILAAIAIPNFLQAQTRAKVSRAQADMRSIATALESYYVDHNDYPLCGYDGVPEDTGWHFLNYTITTPIAYLTDIGLEDPFFANAEGYSDDGLAASPWLRNFRYVNYDIVYNDFLEAPAAFTRYNRIYGMWALFSRGPDNFYRFGSHYLYDPDDLWLSSVPYDPTNGTVSIGDITRCQLGEPNFGPVEWDEIY